MRFGQLNAFEEHAVLYNRFMAVFDRAQYFSDALGVDGIEPAAIPMEKIQTVARSLFT